MTSRLTRLTTIREQLIEERDGAMKEADFQTAVSLSHVISAMAEVLYNLNPPPCIKPLPKTTDFEPFVPLNTEGRD